MKTVELTNAQFKKIPGYTTEISVSRWKGKIFSLLDEMDVDAQGWIKDKRAETEILAFSMTVQIGNVEKIIDYRMEPVMIVVNKKVGHRYGPTELVPMKKASWKLFHDLLERKVAAAKVGIVDVHHEFMSYITKQLPDGSIGTFADFMDMVIERQPGIEGLQLEYKREPKPVDSQVVEPREGM